MLPVAAPDLIALGGKDFGHGPAVQGGEDGVDLDGVVALAHGVLHHVVVLLGIIQQVQRVVFLDDLPPAELELGGIGPQLLVGLAADELVDGQVQGLALDVPAGGVDGGHGGGDHHPAAHAPEGVAMEVFPDLLRVKGVHADDQLGEVLALAPGRLGTLAVGQARLTEAADALIGVDFDGDKAAQAAAGQITFHARNFHVLAPFVFRGWTGGQG